MKKLAFLVGTWTGDATTVRPNQKIKVKQTEEVSYKLDGLVLLIEGTGRDSDSGEVMFRALATVSYNDAAGVYHFRAYNALGECSDFRPRGQVFPVWRV